MLTLADPNLSSLLNSRTGSNILCCLGPTTTLIKCSVDVKGGLSFLLSPIEMSLAVPSRPPRAFFFPFLDPKDCAIQIPCFGNLPVRISFYS